MASAAKAVRNLRRVCFKTKAEIEREKLKQIVKFFFVIFILFSKN